MQEELRQKAKKRVETKMAFIICAMAFIFASTILMILSFLLPGAAFWLRLPIPAMALTLGIIYLSMFGLPPSWTLSKEWQEKEIDKEMKKLYLQKRLSLPPAKELTETDRLELKELERLKKKWESSDDYI